MAIEQSVFTCCRARRETGTTGFGYYTVTAGMDALRRSSQQLSLMSSSYAAPRNQELWWSSAADEGVRNAEEKAAIAKHHPEAFTYRVIEEGGITKAVFSFGKNLGRDIQGFRPGNILVSTAAADMADVELYPFEYFGSPEIFAGYDREFFVNASDEPAADIERPAALTAGGRISREDAESFINEDPQRSELLMMMLQFVLDYNDPAQVTRQVMICDRMENIIYWTAALSLIFPQEIAKRFSFCTYSFLGSPDSGTVSLEPTMLCGVYSPSVNGDPEDLRATNYDFEFEAERIESALFDFEHGFYTESEPRCGYFAMMLKSALMGGFSGLADYHRFLIERTDYRTIDNDFAKGSSVYLILRFKNQMSLNYLSDAVAFAEKYMDADVLAELLDTALGCTADQGVMSNAFGEMTELAVKCIDAGVKDKQEVYDRLLSFLKGAFLGQTLSRDEYLEAKDDIKSIFERCGDSFEPMFADMMSRDTLKDELAHVTKKWVLFELAELLSRKAAAAGREGSCSDQPDAVLFRETVSRALSCEESDRGALIGVFGDMFTDSGKADFAEALLMSTEKGSAVYGDTVGYMAEQYIGGCNDMAVLADINDIEQDFVSACCERLTADGGFEKAIGVARKLCGDTASGAFAGSVCRITDMLIGLAQDEDAEKHAANVYMISEIAETAVDDRADAVKKVCVAFGRAVRDHGKWYSPSETVAEMAISLAESCGSEAFESAEDRNLLLICGAAAGQSDDGGAVLDCSAITKDDMSGVSAALAEIMTVRASGGDSILKMPMYIDTDSVPHPGITEETLIRVFRTVLKSQGKDQRAKPAAETAVRLLICGNVNFRRLGEDMYEYKLKPDDLKDELGSKEIYAYIKEHGKTEAALNKLSDELTEGYDSKRQGGVFGKLRSRFGKGKNG